MVPGLKSSSRKNGLEEIGTVMAILRGELLTESWSSIFEERGRSSGFEFLRARLGHFPSLRRVPRSFRNKRDELPFSRSLGLLRAKATKCAD